MSGSSVALLHSDKIQQHPDHHRARQALELTTNCVQLVPSTTAFACSPSSQDVLLAIIVCRVTKVTLFLLLIPITWRMVEKARTLYKKESAARQAPALPPPAAPPAPAPHPHTHNPLHRISETYSNLARSSAVIADAYGPDLAFLASSDSRIAEDSKQVEVLPVTQQQQQLKKDPTGTAAAAAAADADLSPSKDINILALSQQATARCCRLAADCSNAAPAASLGLPSSCWNSSSCCSSSSYVHDASQAEQMKARIAKEEAAQLPLLQVGMLALIIASVVITNITGGWAGGLSQCAAAVCAALSSSWYRRTNAIDRAFGATSLHLHFAACQQLAVHASSNPVYSVSSPPTLHSRHCNQQSMNFATSLRLDHYDNLSQAATWCFVAHPASCTTAPTTASRSATCICFATFTGGYLVPCGTTRYWLVVLSPLPLMLIVWSVIRQHVLWKADVKRCLGLKQAGDLKWNSR
jgi:hypothetical protein